MSDLLLKTENNIATIAMNAAPVNALGQPLRAAIYAAVQDALHNDAIAMIVLTSTAKLFCAGADITEFNTERAFASPSLPELCDLIDHARKPVVALINGDALGGGLELALAADYRVLAEHARVGLPEVTLGLIPGAGGTQRLPRFVGAEKALTMIAGGKAISANDAKISGLVDVVLSSSAFECEAEKVCRDFLSKGVPALDCADILVDENAIAADFFQQFLARQLPAQRGGFAARQGVEAVARALSQPLDEGLASEAALFRECETNPQSRALQHLFFSQRAASRIEGVDKNTPVKSLNAVAVIGTGTMGSGIAMCFLSAGLPVILLDSHEEGLARGRATIEQNYQKMLQRGRITEQQCVHCLSLLQTASEYSALADVDLVVEAVFEDMAVKTAVFSALDAACKPGCILASNTSTLDLDAIAACTSRPQDVIGMHFFSPAHVMKLLEIVRGEATSAECLNTVHKLSKRLGKVGVVVGVCYGFVGNRMVAPYSREAFRVLLEGASPAQSDAALTEFGMAMGAVSMADMAGIDVGCMAAEANKHEWQDDSTYQALQFALRERGWLGQKTGRGVYRYEGRLKQASPDVQAIIAAIAHEHAIAPRDLAQAEIADRCILMLINEGAHILQEGIASRPGDIDLIYVHGYGFPAWRGGPMHYADEIGLPTVVSRLQSLCTSLGAYGERWFKPAPLLLRLAEQGASFAQWRQ